MPDDILFPILLQVVLISLNAVFACAEIAILSMSEAKLAQLTGQGNRRARRLTRLTEQPARFLATIQIAITLSGFLGSAFADDNFSHRLVGVLVRAGVSLNERTLQTVSVILITVLLSYFTLVFGELVPKRLAMKKADTLALALSGLIFGISKVFAPVVAVLTASTNLVLRLLGLDPNADEEEVSEEEIQMMVDRGSAKGIFDRDTRNFIENVFRFDDLTAGEFATHRTEVRFLWTDQPLDEWERIIFSAKHTRYPVCRDTVDQVLGILDAREFFRYRALPQEEILARAVHPAFFVPETVKADVLFRQMKARRNYYAVVLDEHGGVFGVVTINDLLEQLVGDMGAVLPDIEALGPDTWRVSGSARMEEVAQALEVELPVEEYETFGGYVFGLHGSVPPDGQTVSLQAGPLEIRVTRIHNHKLEEAVVRRLPRRNEPTP